MPATRCSGADLFHRAERYIGIRELGTPGTPGAHHPLIQWWLSLCAFGYDAADETPWCSAFLNGMAWQERLPRSKSVAARSWLTVGVPQRLEDVQLGDVVILARGSGVQPGPEVLRAPGHVGLFAGFTPSGDVLLLAGNQGNAVSIQGFPLTQLLGIRRITS